MGSWYRLCCCTHHGGVESGKSEGVMALRTTSVTLTGGSLVFEAVARNVLYFRGWAGGTQ
jgi:hypothetical protein